MSAGLLLSAFTGCSAFRNSVESGNTLPQKKSITPVAEAQTSRSLELCPNLALGETELDCPFAGIVRELEPRMTSIESTKAAFKELAPEVFSRLEKEGSISKEFKLLWGKSLNFDEGAKSIIMNSNLYDALAEIMGDVPMHDDRIVHAGTEHTYGYLFSNLKTPYGYKRLRWVRPDIEQGFGLSEKTISPFPMDGGLFANVTAFAGCIAFRNEPEALKVLDSQKSMVAKAINDYDFASLKVTRVEETVQISENRTVTLRTDFVPFTKGAFGGNAEVLIYSVLDSENGMPYLISMFPVAAGFRNGPMKPETLGENQPIQTRYNAYVPGMTDPMKAKVWTGTRKVIAP